MNPPDEARERREEITKQALSQVVRERMYHGPRRMSQTDLARWSGVSRSFVQSILRADGSSWLFLFLELCDGLKADPREVLRDVLNQRDVIRRINGAT